ncbi:MAG: dTDP-glucose 4,6-dehydratase [Desulfobacterales bacterium]|nr:dTDP-glucose 4,6-dehydratase [Desulfobacterales bacterium]
MSKILVTGAAGFIGSNFVRYWLAENPGDGIVVLDALTYAGNFESLKDLSPQPNFTFIHGDILDQPLVEDLLREHRVDTLVHFAAESHVDRSIVGPDAFIQTNVVGTHSLLKAAKACWLDSGSGLPHRFHHVSTDEVYGSLGPRDPSFRESSPYAPNSPYAASKAASDHLVRAYGETYGLHTTISNCSNNYGPYQFPEKLIPLCIANILDSKPLPIYGDGLQIRDWLYVDDHNRAIDLILKEGRPGRVYNIGGNNEWTNLDIVRRICRLMDEQFVAHPHLNTMFPHAAPARGHRSESLITHVRDRAGHDRRYSVNAGRISRELGYAPKESFETGITKTLAWYLENTVWWKGIMDQSYLKWVENQYGESLETNTP